MSDPPDGIGAAELAALHADLRRLGATVAVAESLTGGLLTAALTDTAGASATMRGGLVVYATDLKERLAGVSGRLLAERGAVDPDVAAQLARGARERLSATYGVGVTGVAGPDPQDGKPVGTVYVGVAGPDGVRVDALQLGADGAGRETIRRATVAAGIEALRTEIRAAITALRSP